MGLNEFGGLGFNSPARNHICNNRSFMNSSGTPINNNFKKKFLSRGD